MTDILTLRKFESLSPFEIKDELIKLAKKTSRTTQSAFLNAGRGNPNWVATTPREGFFLLGQFAVTESKRVMDHPAGVGGMPQAAGIAGRLDCDWGRRDRYPAREEYSYCGYGPDVCGGSRARSPRSDTGTTVEPKWTTNHPGSIRLASDLLSLG